MRTFRFINERKRVSSLTSESECLHQSAKPTSSLGDEVAVFISEHSERLHQALCAVFVFLRFQALKFFAFAISRADCITLFERITYTCFASDHIRGIAAIFLILFVTLNEYVSTVFIDLRRARQKRSKGEIYRRAVALKFAEKLFFIGSFFIRGDDLFYCALRRFAVSFKR